MCRCPPTWTGRRCETDVDECDSLLGLCGRNGSCLNLPGDFQCQCDPGFTGSMCDEDIDECSLSEDLCTYVGNFPPFTPNATLFLERANMPTLYTNTTEIKNSTEGSLFINGSSSDLPTSPPWPDEPVSHMVCVNTQPGYSCICQVGWKGTKCDQTLTERPRLDAKSAPESPKTTYSTYQDHGVPKALNKDRIQESELFEGKELNLTCTFTHGITPSGKEITKVHPVLRVGGETLSDSELTSVLKTLSTKETIVMNLTLFTGDVKIIPSIIPDHDKTFHMWYLAPIIAGLLLLLVSVTAFVIYLRGNKNKPACEEPASREQQSNFGACFKNAVYTENLENERKEKEVRKTWLRINIVSHTTV
ncbi:neurogenic locus notch like protein 2 [Plakobranchus ocellatus]|uniref:Neurogenic locus notch like protein 2 n=1 Tax=Plakobranchus ocellatus TaxID=259542 RepID=A0AAV3ZIE3_9GAST|nr:neurogenic locus notch like protein 2 [Plakobranchus ocellatus]